MGQKTLSNDSEKMTELSFWVNYVFKTQQKDGWYDSRGHCKSMFNFFIRHQKMFSRTETNDAPEFTQSLSLSVFFCLHSSLSYHPSIIKIWMFFFIHAFALNTLHWFTHEISLKFLNGFLSLIYFNCWFLNTVHFCSIPCVDLKLPKYYLLPMFFFCLNILVFALPMSLFGFFICLLIY